MEHIQEGDRSKWMAHSNHTIKCFTKGDIDRMTNSYRTSLGSGGFGEVYEGVLEDGSKVAVKMFIHNVKEDFAKELIVHREINHKNVVRLIGCCEEENALMLVTEYIANGNLSDFLHNDKSPIPLDMRLSIATECAEALAYMHSHMYTQVIHGDIKPDNILLDSNFHAKLSDFGISRLADRDKTLHTNNFIGSIGYMDPSFAQDGLLTSKSDVYSFGVVLFQPITRKKAKPIVDSVNIFKAFTNALASGVRGVRVMFDAEIASKYNLKIVERVAKIAGECLIVEREKRPEMIDVVERLRVLRKALYQDQDRFSWVRRKSKPVSPSAVMAKSKPASPVAVTAPPKTLPLGPCRQFSLEEMRDATRAFNLSFLIHDPYGFSRVYIGKIDGASTKVAIKTDLDLDHNNYLIEATSKLCHINLVPLIGYCDEGNKMLVYQYMARGSLHEHLYGTQKPPLSWEQRIKICIGAARGLRYLHESQLTHGSMVPRHILLDEEWLAKITGISLPEAVYDNDTLLVCIKPESTEERDVYSFGVVLLQVLCARTAYSPKGYEKEQYTLVDSATRCKKRNFHQIVDPYLKGKINPLCFDKFFSTAAKCLAPRDIDRPSMGDVILDLEYALQLQESAEASEGLAGSISDEGRQPGPYIAQTQSTIARPPNLKAPKSAIRPPKYI
ncbi:unnamed protein product [Urochloa decumbens]|uniref:Protein kinase domain-containing protein n=1 Tax=Urochloa decumbens TaxID=240449 RepID=A0ABC8WTP7_9POAL